MSRRSAAAEGSRPRDREVSTDAANSAKRGRDEGRLAEEGAAAGGGTMKYLLLLIPCVVALCPPLYNASAPELFGLPFFYWFQLLLIPVSVVMIYAFDRLARA
jgi:uncharacterized protein DUF3311